MTVDVLASGSKGNCTAITVGDKLLLIDCGLSCGKILGKLNGHLPDAVIITHEHGDHAFCALQFLKRAVDIYLTDGTRKALRLIDRHNMHIIKAGTEFELFDLKITPLKSIHDAAEPVNFIIADDVDRVLFVTDTGAVPQVNGSFTKIFIEANYSEPALLASDINEFQRQRILENHLSIEQAENFLKQYPDADATLIHLSRRHAAADEFKRRIQNVHRKQDH